MTIPTITDDLIAEIEAAAKAATPGPRRVEDDEDSCAGAVFICSGLEMHTGGEICRSYSYDDADLIAAMSPEVVLALTAHIRQLEKDAARYKKVRDLGFLDRMVPLHVCDEHLRSERTDEYIDAMQATQ